ncbi:hypothetical protein HaLaN_20295 [Haematococcus lacustris]|uniref:Uncharacterized protein n=1 Tax=Haematococcus lacustris TaxID=44745 RepID=A0A6A0A1D7_HAELA|nr:hypothetical protein HaLaN_20295 [Haematococcus lacustris]
MERSGVAGHHAPVSVAHLQAELAVMRARCAALETALEASASSPRATPLSTPPAAGPQASAASRPAVQEEFNQAFNDSWQEWKEGKSDMDMDMDWVSLPAGHPDCVHRPQLPDARTCTVESVRRGSEEHGVRSGLSYFEYDAQRGPRSDPFAWQWKAVFVSSKFAAMMGQSDQQRTISSMNNSMNVSVPLSIDEVLGSAGGVPALHDKLCMRPSACQVIDWSVHRDDHYGNHNEMLDPHNGKRSSASVGLALASLHPRTSFCMAEACGPEPPPDASPHVPVCAPGSPGPQVHPSHGQHPGHLRGCAVPEPRLSGNVWLPSASCLNVCP